MENNKSDQVNPLDSDSKVPETVEIELSPEDQIEALLEEIKSLKSYQNKATKRYTKEQALKPYQAELIGLQHYLEKTKKRMIILYEGRDASGKGGTIRRVSRYMNEKHYRVVALGKPTELQKSQWYFPPSKI